MCTKSLFGVLYEILGILLSEKLIKPTSENSTITTNINNNRFDGPCFDYRLEFVEKNITGRSMIGDYIIIISTSLNDNT